MKISSCREIVCFLSLSCQRMLLSLFTLLVVNFAFAATEPLSAARLEQLNTPHLAAVNIAYEKNKLFITNITKSPIVLRNAILSLRTHSKVLSVSSLRNLKFNLKFASKTNYSHSNGRLYQIEFGDTQEVINPGETFQLNLSLSGNDAPTAFQLLILDPVPVQVQIIVDKSNWTQTISVCNNSTYPIPLKNIEFNFNFTGPVINNVWGKPWAAWTVASRVGSQYVLRGGTPYIADLLPDPTCSKPLTIQFNSTPTTPPPSGPFVFKSAGAVPVGFGSLKIKLPNSPQPNLTNPSVRVSGMGVTQEQVIKWGEEWLLNDLAPGTFNITANRVDNGQNFYQISPITVNVEADKTTSVEMTYQAVATGKVTVNFVNSPTPDQQVIFTGQNYQFNKVVSANTPILLPADKYMVTVSLPGYSSQINPNPLTIPNDTVLSIIYQKNNLSAVFGGYFESWSTQWANDPSATELANLPSYVNDVYVAFVKPDTSYQQGSLNLSATGLQFSYDNGNILKQAIAILHQKNPKTKVLISIGGATYTNWAQFNPQSIADVVKDFGFDGVDIDYEIANPGCSKGTDGLIHCQIDETYESIIESMRTLLPRPYTISVTAWSIAAYGQDSWSNAQPTGYFTGMMLPFFRSPAAKDIDKVNVMSYDAGQSYDPSQAMAAFNHYFAGPINMGVAVPPEAWGGHVYTLSKVDELSKAVLAAAPAHNTPPGMMMWSLQKKSNQTPSADFPNAQMIATLICTNLGLNNCTAPLISTGSTPTDPILKPVNCQAYPHSREINVNTAVQLKTALTAAKAGDLILLADGVYSGRFISGTAFGTEAAPITLCGSKNAILDSGSLSGGYNLHIKNVNYWNIAGITIRNGQKGIMLDTSNYIHINGVIVHQIGEEAVHFRNNSTHNLIENSWIHNTGKLTPGFGEGVYLGSANSNLVNDKSDFNQVIGNHIGPNVTGENIDIKEYSSNGLIADNYFDGSGLKGDNFADSWIDVKGNGYTIRNNYGTISNLDGFQTHIQVTGWGDFNVFDGNILNVKGPGYGIRVQSPTTGGKNNIIKCNNQVTGAMLGLANMPCTP